jgi:hypothetical protein
VAVAGNRTIEKCKQRAADPRASILCDLGMTVILFRHSNRKSLQRSSGWPVFFPLSRKLHGLAVPGYLVTHSTSTSHLAGLNLIWIRQVPASSSRLSASPAGLLHTPSVLALNVCDSPKAALDTQNVKGPKPRLRFATCDPRLGQEEGRPMMRRPWCDRQLGNPLPDQTWHLAERGLVSHSLQRSNPVRLCAFVTAR